MSDSESKDHVVGEILGSTKAFLIACTAIVASVTMLYDSFMGAPLRADKARLEEKAVQAEVLSSTQAARILELQDRVQTLDDAQKAPVLEQPRMDEHVYGSEVEFDWTYTQNNSGRLQSFVLELATPNGNRLRFPVLNPEQKTMTILGDWLETGQMYFWRVLPGHLTYTTDGQNKTVETGVPSPFGLFTLHKNVLEKIVSTGELRIGTSPTIRGVTNYLNKEGKVCGLDVELIHEFVKYLEKKSKTGEIKVIFVDVVWGELLPVLLSRKVDLVISGMTKTLKREKENPGVRFTQGYFGSEQILIGKKKGDQTKLTTDLEGKILGVIGGTTNFEAALYLAGEANSGPSGKSSDGKFVVDFSYRTYSEIVHALKMDKIDRALVDDIFVKKLLTTSGDIISSDLLTDELQDFYRTLLAPTNSAGKKLKEEFAIAVVDNELLTKLNEYLTESKVVDDLKKKVDEPGSTWECSTLSQL